MRSTCKRARPLAIPRTLQVGARSGATSHAPAVRARSTSNVTGVDPPLPDCGSPRRPALRVATRTETVHLDGHRRNDLNNFSGPSIMETAQLYSRDYWKSFAPALHIEDKSL